MQSFNNEPNKNMFVYGKSKPSKSENKFNTNQTFFFLRFGVNF